MTAAQKLRRLGEKQGEFAHKSAFFAQSVQEAYKSARSISNASADNKYKDAQVVHDSRHKNSEDWAKNRANIRGKILSEVETWVDGPCISSSGDAVTGSCAHLAHHPCMPPHVRGERGSGATHTRNAMCEI